MNKYYRFNQDKKGFGNKLKELMQEKQYTNNDLANAIQCPPETIKKWKNGSRIPEDKQILDSIAKAFNVSLQELYMPRSVYQFEGTAILLDHNIQYRVMTPEENQDIKQYAEYLFQKLLFSFLTLSEKRHLKSVYDSCQLTKYGMDKLNLEKNPSFDLFCSSVREYIQREFGKSLPYRIKEEEAVDIYRNFEKMVVFKDSIRIDWTKTNTVIQEDTSFFESTEWDYIRFNLDAIHVKEADLRDLFDVTSTTIDNWKKGSIPLEKVPVLCELFGITMDQYYNREYNTDVMYEYEDNLLKYRSTGDYKSFSFDDLRYMFERLAKASYYIEHFPTGFITEYWEQLHEELTEYVDPGQIEYFCRLLELNVSFEMKPGIKEKVCSVDYKTLSEICSQLKTVWGEDANSHLTVDYGDHYERILMLSENHEYLNYRLNECFSEPASKQEYMNKLLHLWASLRAENPAYDKKNLMAKTLLALGASFTFSGKVDTDKTMQLCRDLFKADTSESKEN